MNEQIKAGTDIHAGDGGYSIGTPEEYDEFVKVRNKSLGPARIQSLAEQCATPERFDVKKFAELIVRECAGISEQHNRNYYTSHGQIIADKIKQHFGVE